MNNKKRKLLFSIKGNISRQIIDREIDFVKRQINRNESIIFYPDIFTLQENNNKNLIYIERNVGVISEKITLNMTFWMALKIRISGLKNIINISRKNNV